MAAHVLYFLLLFLFGKVAYHSAAFAEPLVVDGLLGVVDLPPVVLAVDRALAQLARENEVTIRRLI
jgi:hypothetical protein